jgi:hypothetical protein
MTTHTVPPLLYPQIRMLAEAALGVPDGESATFTFDPANTNGPLLVPPHAPAPHGVTVPVWNRTRYPDPGQVLLQVETPDGLASLNAVQYRADAVFWSDAAVQKFVLPYYASCMGYDASKRLRKLEAAWNGDVPGKQVLALMHVTGVPRGAEGAGVPMEPLWVVYLENGRLQASALADFPTSDLPAQNAPRPVPYTAPDLARLRPPYPGYTALRSMAEWAASLDTEPMYFTYDPEQRQFGPPRAHANGGGGIVVPVFNPFVRGTRLKPSRVMFGNHELAAECDAVFWSTGAIEQFLLPYYASIDGFAGLRDLQALRDTWLEGRPEVGGNLLKDGREVQYREEGDLSWPPFTIGIEHIWPSMEIPIIELGGTAVRRELVPLRAGPSGGVTRSRFNAPAEEAASAA